MPSTPRGYAYPSGSDPTDVPGDIQALAEDVDADVTAVADAAVAKALFDANTILKADADNTPEPFTVAEQRLVGRITGGEITDLTIVQALTMLLTARGDIIRRGSGGVERLAVGAARTVLTSDGTDAAWAAGPDTTSARVETAQSTTSSTYTDLATAGPAVTVTVPASGELLVVVSASLYSSSSTGLPRMGFALSGGNTLAADDARCLEVKMAVASQNISASIQFHLTGLTPGSTTVTAKYRDGTGASANAEFRRRELAAITW